MVDVTVVGGGLSGLAAAAYLGRAGLRVTVLEKASAPGGRAQTHLDLMLAIHSVVATRKLTAVRPITA